MVPWHSCQRTCPLWWAPLVLERGETGVGGLSCEARAVGGRSGHQAGSLGNTSHTTSYGGVALVPSYIGLVGRGREGVLPAPSTNIVTSPTSKSSSGGCRRWSAASSTWPAPG